MPQTFDRNDDLDLLATEAWDASGADLDLRSTRELVQLMNAADATVADAVAAAGDAIAVAIDAIRGRLDRGGRLVYVGAGTSGRLALLDSAEVSTTFSVPEGLVTTLIAGGAEAVAAAQEHAEDDREQGAADVVSHGVTEADAVVGLSASGRTPYTLGAIEAAHAAGALTVAVISASGSELARLADHEIAVVVGPEIVAGSTRLKAGTAQKLVLNTISTVSMIGLGKTYGNLMVDVVATNEKLRARVHRVVRQATGADTAEVDAALAAADGDAKVAIVCLLAEVEAPEARDRLRVAGGRVRAAVNP